VLYQLSYYRKNQNIKRADTRTRTGDLFITNELLYQLSHIGGYSNELIHFLYVDAKVKDFFLSTKLYPQFFAI
jgi:hypothetical protein